MRKFLAAPFEALHVLGVALFFGIALVLTVLTAPDWLARIGKVSPESAGHYFSEITSLIGRKGLWIMLAALVGAIAAPYARGDGKKALAWARVACAAAILVLAATVWGGFGGDWTGKPGLATRAKSTSITPWQCLALAGALDLALVAFAVTGGAAKKAAADAGAKK